MGMRGNLVQRGRGRAAASCTLILGLALALAGCFGETFQRGYVLPDGALEQIPLGASQEQVLIVLGTPSTVATISGEVFYYISQRTEQTSFLPQKEVDRRVIAVYFDRGRKVERLANTASRTARSSITSAAPRRRADRSRACSASCSASSR